MIVTECSRCRYRSPVPGDLPAETLLRCGRCGARGRFMLVSAEAGARLASAHRTAANRSEPPRGLMPDEG